MPEPAALARTTMPEPTEATRTTIRETGLTPTATRELAELSWTGVPYRPLVLVPLGSTEQHGPHLPAGADTMIATAVARAVAARLPGPVLVAPALWYGASGEHQGFPGTLSIGHEALRLLLVELVRSLSLWAGQTIFVNGHGGNLRGLTAAIIQLRGEGHEVAWVPGTPPGDDPADSHAGHVETSLLLHLSPDLVETARAAPGARAPLAELMPAIAAGGIAAVAPSGVLGDPTTASAPEGGRLLAELTDDVLARIRAGRTDQHGCLHRPPASR